MHITYDETLKLFRLTAGDMLYAMGITDGAYLAHIYFGKNLPDADLTELLRLDENPFTPSVNNRDKASYMDTLPFECSCFCWGYTHSWRWADRWRFPCCSSSTPPR